MDLTFHNTFILFLIIKNSLKGCLEELGKAYEISAMKLFKTCLNSPMKVVMMVLIS